MVEFTSSKQTTSIFIEYDILDKNPKWYFSMLARHYTSPIHTDLSEHDLSLIDHYFTTRKFPCPYIIENIPDGFDSFKDMIDFLGFDLTYDEIDFEDSDSSVEFTDSQEEFFDDVTDEDAREEWDHIKELEYFQCSNPIF